MAGLLDWIGTPEGQGLLSAAFGGLAGAGRGQPVNTIGRAGMSGLLGYGQAQDRQARLAEEGQQREVRDMQLKKLRADFSDEELARSTAMKYFTPGTPAVGGLESSLPPELRTGIAPVAAVPPKFDTQGFAQARMAQNPTAGIKLLSELQKEMPINKLDAKDYTPESVQRFATTKNYGDLVRMDKLHFADTGGAIAGLNPFTGAAVGTSTPKTGNPFSDLVVADGNGGVKPNSPLVNVKTGIARAGAPSVNVNTDKSYFGNIAEGLAKNDVSAIESAQSAPNRIASAQRIKQILQQNPITGTGADVRLGVNKALATAGIIDPNQTNATEALVTELAGQTLDSIKGSGLGAGQGFTDKDRAFLQDARSGRIEMTPTNIGRIADLNEQSARLTIKRGNSVISKLRMSPEAGKLGQQLDLVEEPAAPKSAPTVVRRGMYGGKKVLEMSDGTVKYAD